MMRGKALLLGLTIFLLWSCSAPITNLSPVHLKDKPRFRVLKSPALDRVQHETFSLVPASCLKREPLIQRDALETKLLFSLRNVLEVRGYRYVKMNENPDIVATIDSVIVYDRRDLPPEALTPPDWLLSERLADLGTPHGSQRLDNCASTRSNGIGSFNAMTPSVNDMSNSSVTETYTEPSPPAMLLYPIIRIGVLDPDPLKTLWTGIGAGTADNSDLSVSSQAILIFLMDEFPRGPLSHDQLMGAYGFGFFVFTNNGVEYYPTVFKVIDGSPAHKAGLRKYDMISSIDGVSMRNKPLSEVLRAFQTPAEKKQSFIVRRVDKEIQLEISPLLQ